MEIDAIIFDLGGVFIHIDYEATIAEFRRLGFRNPHELYSQKEQAFLFQHYETGKISTPHFINKLLEFVDSKPSPNQIVRGWNAMLGKIELTSIDVLKSLQGKKRLFMLSNTNEMHWEIVQRKWNLMDSNPIESYFEKIYVSHEFGMRKPHVSTFQAVCLNNQLDTSSTLFIDDSIQHIDGAKEAGLQTLHLTDILQLDVKMNQFI
jgi:FMN phosphatase YigB (HAD superfamily)